MFAIRCARLPAVLWVLTGITSGCDPVGTLDPAAGLGGSPRAGMHPVPFKASYTWRVVAPAPGPGCDGPGEVRSFLEGEGTGTQLGRFTITLNHCAAPGLPLTDGHGTFVAANGDLLHITYFGVGGLTGSFPIFNFESRVQFVGGTGRFASAAGSAVVLGTIDVRVLAGSGDWEGEISSQ